MVGHKQKKTDSDGLIKEVVSLCRDSIENPIMAEEMLQHIRQRRFASEAFSQLPKDIPFKLEYLFFHFGRKTLSGLEQNIANARNIFDKLEKMYEAEAEKESLSNTNSIAGSIADNRTALETMQIVRELYKHLTGKEGKRHDPLKKTHFYEWGQPIWNEIFNGVNLKPSFDGTLQTLKKQKYKPETNVLPLIIQRIRDKSPV